MTSMLRTWASIVLAATLTIGCDSSTTPDPDGGALDASEPDAGTDGGERTPPSVVSTLPRDGDVEVDPSTSIRVFFSEPVDPAMGGSIEVRAGDELVTLPDPSYGGDMREVTVATASALPGNTAIRVTIRGYHDRAGNAMSREHVVRFTTSDPFAPAVTSATPAEGASGVSPQTTSIELVFSEAMNATLGVAELGGGPGSIGLPSWDGERVSFPVSGLAPDTAYRVALLGLADPAGNALDASAYLADGALDFTTGPDTVAPIVTESSPSEGATGVPPSRTTRARLVFSEPMDRSAGTAELDDGGATTTLTASWAGGDRILLLDVSGLLEADRDYRIRLSGFADAAGNALDTATYLADGALDFSTGGDELPPFVLYSNPAEGTSGVPWTTNSVFVTFSESMDTASAAVPFTDGVSSGTLSGTWSSGGALLELDVAGRLISGRTYVLDFTAFGDADGLPLDATHAYLGDGRLTFTTAAPRGENCQDFLTNADATVTAEDHHVWTIAASDVTNVDGAAPCDASGGSADAVIRYRKSSPDSTDASGAGRVLRITVTSSSTLTDRSVNVDVLRDACDPTSSAARLACTTNGNPQSIDVDVPAGDYFVWIAASATAWRGATVRVEEIPAGLGDTCRNAIPITAGTTPITPSGTGDVQAPSCAGGGAFTWYRYTAAQRLGIVRLGAARALGAVDAASAQPLLCRLDAATTPMPVVVEPGSDVCVAVGAGSATTITIEERAYDGVRGVVTDLGVSYPTGAFGAPSIPYMGVTPSRVFLSSTSSDIFHAPRAGGVVATRTIPPTAHRVPGPHGVTIGEAYYSLARGSFSLTSPQPMVLRVTDAADAFLDPPAPIDTTQPYVLAQPMAAIVVDGIDFLLAQDSPSGTGITYFYRVPIAGGPAELAGSNNSLQSVAAMAVDSTFVYVISRAFGGAQESEGIYRLRRDELTSADAVPFLVYGGGHNWNDGTAALFLESLGGTEWLYFRTYGPAHIHMLLDPDEASPLYLGPLWTTSTGNQTGMGYDPATPALFFIDHGGSDDRWMRMD